MKNNSKSIGNYYEKLAGDYLLKLGYNIIANNYRYKTIEIYRPLEIDIIATKEKTIYFFEIKYRKTIKNYFPYSPKKLQNIIDCGENFLYHNPIYYEYFMNISWIIITNNTIEIFNNVSI